MSIPFSCDSKRSYHAFTNLYKPFEYLLNFCVRDGLINESPFAKLKMPQLEQKVLEPLTHEQVRTIIDACKYERDKAIFYFLLDSGVRASELCMLTVGDINFSSGAAIVRLGKGQKGRVTYIGPKTCKQIQRYFVKERGNLQKDFEPLFSRQDNGMHMNYDGLKQLVRRIRNETKLRFSCHDFRRTFALHCLRKGMNI